MSFRIKKLFKRAVAFVAIFCIFFPSITPAVAQWWNFSAGDLNVPESRRTKIVSILVEESLLNNNELEDKIERYAIDVQNAVNAQVVLVAIPPTAEPWEIFEGQSSLFFSGKDDDNLSQLIGTVFIGNVPLPIVEKNENVTPSVFPYVDFEQRTYEWNQKKNRFVFEGGDHEAEIWHGLIRSDSGSADGREEELIQYFDRNHRVHTGEITYAKKVFFWDEPNQKEGLFDKQREMYDNWIEFSEHIIYNRFTKHWAKQILEAFDVNSLIDDALIPEDLRGEKQTPDETSAALDNVPDVHTKFMIESLTKRYFEAWDNFLSKVNFRISQSGRWGVEDTDTTITLISEKDQWALDFLKTLSDALEVAMTQPLIDYNIATDLVVDEDVKNYSLPSKSFPNCTGGGSSTRSGASKDLPAFWNGVSRAELEVEDCTYLRGLVRTEENPRAQLVTANRSYWLDSKTDCSTGISGGGCDQGDGDAYLCMVDECCSDNLDYDSGEKEFNAPQCLPNRGIGAEWYGRGSGTEWAGAWVGECYQEAEKQWTHVAGEPIIDLRGTKEVFTGVPGALGCEPILDLQLEYDESDPPRKFTSLMMHNEPRIATVNAQVSSMQAMAMPVDYPRGFSFLDHGTILDYYYDEILDVYRPAVHPLSNSYHRVPFMNIFDFRNHSYSDLDFEEAVYAAARKNIVDLNAITAEGDLKSNYRLLLDMNNLMFEVVSTKWEEIQGISNISENQLESDIDATRNTFSSLFGSFEFEAEMNAAFDVAKADTATAVTAGQFRSSNETAGQEVSLTIGVAKVTLDTLLTTEETEMASLISSTKTDVISLANTALTDVGNELNTTAMEAEITARETAITNSIDAEKTKVTTAATSAESTVTTYFLGSCVGALDMTSLETTLNTVVPDLNTDLAGIPNALAINLNALNTGTESGLQTVGTNLNNDLSTENTSLLASLESRRTTLKTNIQVAGDTMDDQLGEINTEEEIELDPGDLDSFNVTMQAINATLLQSLKGGNNDLRDALKLENTGLLDRNTTNLDVYVSDLQEIAGEAEVVLDQEFIVSKNQFYPYYSDSYFDAQRNIYDAAVVGLGALPTERMDLNDALDIEKSQLDQVETLHDTVVLNDAMEALRTTDLWGDVEDALGILGTNMHMVNAKILDTVHLESDEYNWIKDELYTDLDTEIDDTYTALNNSIVSGIAQFSTDIGQAKSDLTTEINAAKTRFDALLIATVDSDGPRVPFTEGSGNWIDNGIDNIEDFIEAGNETFTDILSSFYTLYGTTVTGFSSNISTEISTRQTNLNSILTTELALPSGNVQTLINTNYSNLQTVIANNPTCVTASETVILNQLTTLETNILADLESLKTQLLNQLTLLEGSIQTNFSNTETTLDTQIANVRDDLSDLLIEEEQELTTVSGLLNDIRNQFYSEFGFTDAQLNVLLGNIGSGLLTLLDTFQETVSLGGASDLLTIHHQILQDTLTEYDSDVVLNLGLFQTKYEETRELEDLVNTWDITAGRPDHLITDYHSFLVNVLDSLYEIELAWTYGNVPTEAANWYSTGGFIPVDILEPVFQNYTFPEILDALRWLDLDIVAKNEEVLTGAFSGEADGKRILRKEDFNGYELVEIIGESSDFPPGEGLKLAFELGVEEPSNVFKDAQFEESSFVQDRTIPGALSSFDDDFLGNVLAQPSGDESSNDSTGRKVNNCTDKSLLTWPACFVKWVTELPTVFTQMTTIVADPIDEMLQDFTVPQEETTTSSSSSNTNSKPKNIRDRIAMKVFSAHREVDEETLQVDTVEFSPTQIILSATDPVPQKVEVILKNSEGDVLTSDFETEVELVPSSAEAIDFFRVQPSQKIKVNGGIAKFFLVPKGADHGGRFSLTFKAAGEISESLPVSVMAQKATLFAIETEATVKQAEPLSLEAYIQNIEGSLAQDWNGKSLVFSSEWGTFSNGGEVAVEEGIAKIFFYPGKKAGEAIITVTDAEATLPAGDLKIKLNPDVPADIQISSPLDKLVVDGEGVKVRAAVVDQFGNPIAEYAEAIKWQIENLEKLNEPIVREGSSEVFIKRDRLDSDIQETKKEKLKPSLKQLQARVIETEISDIRTSDPLEKPTVRSLESVLEKEVIKDGEENVLSRELETGDPIISLETEEALDQEEEETPSEEIIWTSDTPAVRVTAPDVLPEVATRKGFGTIVNPIMKVDLLRSEAIAGTEKAIMAKVVAVDSEGELVPGSFRVTILPDKSTIGEFPESFWIRDGVGVFSFLSGIKAGQVSVQLSSLGFVTHTFSFKVKHAEATKILFFPERETIDADDTEPTILTTRVIDSYGNLATEYSGKVSIITNPPEKITQEESDLLFELGIVEKGNTDVEAYFDAQIESTQDIPETDLIEFDSEIVDVKNGIGETEISPQGRSGKLFLIADNEELIPATLEIEVSKIIDREDFGSVYSPKSLLTLLLGMNGGKLNTPNVGNRLLFNTDTQAVATIMSDLNPRKLFGFIQPDAKADPSLDIEIKQGTQLDVLLHKDNQTLGVAKVYFAENPRIVLQASDFAEDHARGIHIISSHEELTEEDRVLSLGDEKLLTIAAQGGVFIAHPKVELKSIENSLLEWNLLFDGESIATMRWTPESHSLIATKEGQSRFGFENISGIVVENQSPESFVEKRMVGYSSVEEMGIGFVAYQEEESNDRKFGSPQVSIEDVLENPNVGWTTDWKPGLLLAAGASIGESTMWGSGDNFILLGDPTLSVATENEKSDLDLTPDMGKPIWKSPFGAIEQILVGDVNGDGRAEVLNRIGNTLYALYQDRLERDDFRHTGPILRFADEVKKVVTYENASNDLDYIIQVNERGDLIFHKNENGVFTRTSMDLGIKNPLEDIAVGNLNGDKYDDLVLLDDQSTLYFAYGRAGDEDTETKEPLRPAHGEFYGAQVLETFAPSIDTITEEYIAAKGQDLFFGNRNVEQLQTFFVRFDGIENSLWTERLQTVAGELFAPLIYNKLFNASFKMEPKGDTTQVAPGDLFRIEFTITSIAELKNASFTAPSFAQMEFVKDSFNVNDKDIKENMRLSSHKDGLYFTGFSIPAQKKITFEWEVKLTGIPPLTFTLEDFEGADGVDDVAIPWTGNDGEKKFIQYVSVGSKSYPSYGIQENATEDAPLSPIARTHAKVISAAFDSFPDDFDAEGTGEEVLNYLKGGGTGTGGDSGNCESVSPYYQTSSMLGSLAQSVSKCGAGGCGLPIPSIAFLAPGPQSIYVPPFGFPNPLPQTGMPLLWIGPTPPFVGIGPNPTSFFRMYVMPTTTLQVGIGLCGGPVINPLMTPTGSPFPPQCFVIVPPLGDMGNNQCSSGGSSGSDPNSCPWSSSVSPGLKLAQQSFADNGKGDNNLGSFKPKNNLRSVNRQTLAADIIMIWLQFQIREFANFKFPSFNFLVPSFPESSPGRGEKSAIQKLQESPFIHIKRRKISIPYPDFTDSQLNVFKTNIEAWKSQMGSWKEANLQKVRLFQADIENVLNQIDANIEKLGQYVAVVREQFDSAEEQLSNSLQNQRQELETAITDMDKNIGELDSFLKEQKAELDAMGAESSTEKKALKKEIEGGEASLKSLKASRKVLEMGQEQFGRYETEIRSELTKRRSEVLGLLERDIQVIREKFQKLKVQVKDLLVELSYIEDVLKTVEEVGSKIDQNLKALQSYKTAIEQLRVLPNKLTHLFDQVVEINLLTAEYWTEWLEANKKSAQKWKQFSAQIESFFEILTSIPKIFADFHTNCNGCKITRGTLLPWLIKMLLGWLKLPVIPMPRFPDIVVDLTKIGIGMDLVVPEISFEPVEFTLPPLPQLPVIVLPDISLGVPQLPSAEEFANMDIFLPFSILEFIFDGGLKAKLLTLLDMELAKLLEKIFPTIPLTGVLDDLALTIDRISLPKLPTVAFAQNIPVLPAISTINFDVSLPPIQFPTLPVLIEPPKIPDFLKSLQVIVSIPKAFLKLFCLLVGGIIPIPEYKVGSQVAEMTNRNILLPLDFVSPAMAPMIPKPEIKPIVIQPQLGYVTVLESINQQIEQFAQTFEGVVQQIGDMKAGLEPPALQMPGGEEISIPNTSTSISSPSGSTEQSSSESMQTFNQKEKQIQSENEDSSEKGFNSVEEKSLEDRKQLLEKKKPFIESISLYDTVPEAEPVSLVQELQSADPLEAVAFLDQYLTDQGVETKNSLPQTVLAAAEYLFTKQTTRKTTLSDKIRGWLVSTQTIILPEDYPSEIPDDYDYSDDEETMTDPVPEPMMYYFDANANQVESITPIALEGLLHTYMVADLDRDGEVEILYSLGSELYLKRRIDPTSKTDGKDYYYPAVLQSRYGNDDREEFEPIEKFTEWDYEDFTKKFFPGWEQDSSVDALGSDINFFAPFSEDINYFEWIMSERPDQVFELTKDSDDRYSNDWKRIAFLVRSPLKKYEVRPTSSIVSRVKGNPILYGSPKLEVELLQPGDCENKEVVKPFFSTETILVAEEDSRMHVQTLPREGQQEESRWIDLREGEETAVDYAEVCLIRGAVKHIDATTTSEKFEVQKGDYFFDGMRMELGTNDSVTLTLFDGTDIEINSGEHYEIHTFTDREEMLYYFKYLPHGNLYGSFIGYGPDKESFSISKMLHDPQLGDDDTPPEIDIAEGTNLTRYLYESIELDASATYDDFGIGRVYWKDKNGRILVDSDKYKSDIPEKYLSISFAPKERPEEIQVTLVVEDFSGNVAEKLVNISIEAPRLKLWEVSERDNKAVGKVIEGTAGIKINYLRERDNQKRALVETSISEEGGRFGLGNITDSGTVEVFEVDEAVAMQLANKKAKEAEKEVSGEEDMAQQFESLDPLALVSENVRKKIAEVQPNGRIVVMDDEHHTEVKFASGEQPFRIRVANQKDQTVFWEYLVFEGGGDVIVDEESEEFSPDAGSKSVQIWDRNPEDAYVWEKFPATNDDMAGAVALVDTDKNKTLVIITPDGNVKRIEDGGAYARIKEAKSAGTPLVFELIGAEKNILAEFFIPLEEKVKVTAEEEKAKK